MRSFWDDENAYDGEYKIRYWYDRLTRSWVIQVLDEEDNEIDNSYVGNKVDRDAEIEYFAGKYNVTDIRHY